MEGSHLMPFLGQHLQSAMQVFTCKVRYEHHDSTKNMVCQGVITACPSHGLEPPRKAETVGI